MLEKTRFFRSFVVVLLSAYSVGGQPLGFALHACERESAPRLELPSVPLEDPVRAALRSIGPVLTGFDRSRDAVCFENGARLGSQALTRVLGPAGTCHGISALEAAFFERARFNPTGRRVGYRYDRDGARVPGASREDIHDREYFRNQVTQAVLALWESGCPGTVALDGYEGLRELCSQGESQHYFADVAANLNVRQTAALLSQHSIGVILAQQRPEDSRTLTRRALLQIIERAARGETSRVLFRPRDTAGASPRFRRDGTFRLREGDALGLSHIVVVTGIEWDESRGLAILHLSDSNAVYSQSVQTMRLHLNSLFASDESSTPLIETAYGHLESHLLDVSDVATPMRQDAGAPRCQEIYRTHCRSIPECSRGEIRLIPQPSVQAEF